MAAGFKLVPRSQVPCLGTRRGYGLNVRVFKAFYDVRHGFVAEVPVKSASCGRHLGQRIKRLARKHRWRVELTAARVARFFISGSRSGDERGVIHHRCSESDARAFGELKCRATDPNGLYEALRRAFLLQEVSNHRFDGHRDVELVLVIQEKAFLVHRKAVAGCEESLRRYQVTPSIPPLPPCSGAFGSGAFQGEREIGCVHEVESDCDAESFGRGHQALKLRQPGQHVYPVSYLYPLFVLNLREANGFERSVDVVASSLRRLARFPGLPADNAGTDRAHDDKAPIRINPPGRERSDGLDHGAVRLTGALGLRGLIEELQSRVYQRATARS